MDPVAALSSALAREPIVRAYLFGSQANRTAGPLSDVDVAILPVKTLSTDDRWALRGRVADAAERAFANPHADVVLLDDARPSLAFHAISGRVLVDREPENRAVFEARIMSEHHDRQYYEERWAEATLQRYLRGEFA